MIKLYGSRIFLCLALVIIAKELKIFHISVKISLKIFVAAITLSYIKLGYNYLDSPSAFHQTIVTYSYQKLLALTSFFIFWHTLVSISLEFPMLIEKKFDKYPNVTCAFLSAEAMIPVIMLMLFVILVISIYMICYSQHFLSIDHENVFFWIMLLFSIVAIFEIIGKIVFNRGFCRPIQMKFFIERYGLKLDEKKLPSPTSPTLPDLTITTSMTAITMLILMICKRLKEKKLGQKLMKEKSTRNFLPIIPKVSEHNQRVLNNGSLFGSNKSTDNPTPSSVNQLNINQDDGIGLNQSRNTPSSSTQMRELSVNQMLNDFSTRSFNNLVSVPKKKLNVKVTDKANRQSANQEKILQPLKYSKNKRSRDQVCHNPRIFITSEQNANALLFGANIKLDNPQILEMDSRATSRSSNYLHRFNNNKIGTSKVNTLRGESYDEEQKILSQLSYPFVVFLLVSIPLLLYWFLGTSILYKVSHELAIYLLPLKVIFYNKDALQYSERKVNRVYDQMLKIDNKYIIVN